MKTLRGQAAAEYLATYGWALFAMFAVVAVLVASGMFGAGRFSSEECVFAPNLPCNYAYFETVPGEPAKLMAVVNLSNAQGFPMLITECNYRLVGGEELDLWNGDPDCDRFVPQGGSFVHTLKLTSNQKLLPSDLRKAYVTYTFRNCQDLDEPHCLIERDPHNTSGRVTAVIRGTP